MKQILIFLALIGISSCTKDEEYNTEYCDEYDIVDVGYAWEMNIYNQDSDTQVLYQYDYGDKVIHTRNVPKNGYSCGRYDKDDESVVPIRWCVNGCWSNWYY